MFLFSLRHMVEFPYSEFLSRDKNFVNIAFCNDLRKVSPRKSIFKQLNTALVGVVHWVTANLWNVFSVKIYFQAIRESSLP